MIIGTQRQAIREIENIINTIIKENKKKKKTKKG